MIGTVVESCPEKFGIFLRPGGRSTCEVIGRRKRGNGLEVPCRYRFVAKWRLIKKLEGLLQKPSHRIVYSLLIL